MIEFSFPKEERIRKAIDFNRICQGGKKKVVDKFILFFDTNSLSKTRFGIAVGRKTKPAVRRNRIKRIVREVLRLNKHKIREGLDIVVLVKKVPIELNFHQVSRDLLNAFEKAGLFK